MIKTLYKEMTPPYIQTQVKNIFLKKKGYFSGPYSSWETAVQAAAGYDDAAILEKIKQATLQVKNNPELYTRDGLIFTEPQHSYPVLAALLKIAIENKGKLRVLDFGGALGATYFGFKQFCPAEIEIQWDVIEQSHFVEYGNTALASEQLAFYHDCRALPEIPDVILLSGVLQYINTPYALLDQLVSLGSPYLLLDRTFFNQKKKVDQILVEHVAEAIYKSSYPFWLFNYQGLIKYVEQYYQILLQFDGLEGELAISGFDITSKGIFAKAKR